MFVGYIYCQEMNEASSAQHGMFYITNVIMATHAEIPETSNTVSGGGVSIYYSQTLKLLFFSYAQGSDAISSLV